MWHFRLYIAGWGGRYATAYRNLRELCEREINQECEIEVVDVQQCPERAGADNVIAIPTVIKLSPEPAMRIVGDLSDAARLLGLLGFKDQI